jgi:enediyne biosynthesis protein E3
MHQHDIAIKMEYVQHLFMQIPTILPPNHNWEEIFHLLDVEGPEFRSIAYESASMEIAFRNLKTNKELNEWKHFYHASKAHKFHIEIGLGWAFARAELDPRSVELIPSFVNQTMVYDGIGYYYALYKGRKFIKQQMLPEELHLPDLSGFDQGLGRRLWYTSQGLPDQLQSFMKPFPEKRFADLWRGVGIAFGYVGGYSGKELDQLIAYSTTWKKDLAAGIYLAGFTRLASHSMTDSIEMAFNRLWNKPLKEILRNQSLDNSRGEMIIPSI